MNVSLFKQPSAVLPLVMSAAALLLIAGYVAGVGLQPRSAPHDEGPAARVFQLLLAGQLPVIAAFGLKWLPKAPASAATVIVLQVAAIATALATIMILEA
jgi:hypothetical protein